MSMLHHLSFAVADLTRSAAFYDAALAPLGYVRAWTHDIAAGYKEAAVGYGLPGADDQFAIRLRSAGVVAPSDGFHLAFSAPSREAVNGFYRAALERERAFYRDAALFRRAVAFTVGPTIFVYGSAMNDVNGAAMFVLLTVVWLVLASLGMFGGRRKRRALERQIEALDITTSAL